MPHNDILAKLKDAVRSVSDNIQNYVSNPGDFSRNGKLPANVLMEFLIGQAIISVIGTDMSRFPTDKHISKWAGLCPGNNESAKKRNSGKTTKGNMTLKTTLVLCAHAAVRVKDSYFAAQFARISVHRGKKRAYVAVAHSMLIAIYHMLRNGTAFMDLGSEYYNAFNRERKAEGCLKKLKQLGYAANIATIADLA